MSVMILSVMIVSVMIVIVIVVVVGVAIAVVVRFLHVDSVPPIDSDADVSTAARRPDGVRSSGQPNGSDRRSRSKRRRAAVALSGLALTLAACATEGTKVFGEHTTPCPATVLTNDAGDAAAATVGGDCFLAEFEAGRPVVWDLLVPTVEGDPMLWRYDYDGQAITITEDRSRDEFGNSGVAARRCLDVVRPGGGRVLEGVDCTSSSGDGFRSDSLPTG